MTLREHWERSADLVIASLIGAWAVQTMVLGLPGLAGLDLPIAEHANVIALVVLGALIVRMLIETVAAHWFPMRLSRVQPAELEPPSTGQRILANLMVTGVFVFVAVSYLGSCWQLYLGGALFLLPNIIGLCAERFPNSPRLHAVLPSGIVETVFLLVVGGIVGAIVLSRLADGRDAIRLALSLLGLFGRDGPEREPGWREPLLGIPLLVFGVLLVLGVIQL